MITTVTDAEIWAPVPDFPHYLVSDMGRVKNTRTDIVLVPHESKKTNYLFVSLSDRQRVVVRLVHQLVLRAFVGEPEVGHECAHENGIRSDNRLSNLRWATKLENAADRDGHGTTARGERNAAAKLTESAVMYIRSSNETHKALGRRFGVSHTAIQYVRSRRNWKHVA